MIPLIFYIGTIVATGITLASQFTSGSPNQQKGGKRHTRKRTVKLTKSRK